MSGGLVALLDDVATLARAAAASVDDIGVAAGRASGKAARVVVDDTAVTPQYVQGLAAERELPIIRRIAVDSLPKSLWSSAGRAAAQPGSSVAAGPDPHAGRRLPVL